MLKKQGVLYKIILLDRAKDEEETIRLYEKILKQNLLDSERKIIRTYAKNILTAIIGKEKLEEIEKNNKKDKEESFMLTQTLLRRMDEREKIGIALGEKRGIALGEKRGIALGEKRGIALGKSEGIALGEKKLRNVAKNMMKVNIDIKIIKQCTGLSEKELNELKNEI